MVATVVKPDNRTIVFNFPAPAEAYMSSTRTFIAAANEVGVANSAKHPVNFNQPHSVANANVLWSNGLSNKGIIQPWNPPSTLQLASGYTDAIRKMGTSNTIPETGFQFLYNPTSINMSYDGLPNVDVGQETSGNDPFNLVGTAVTQSAITFSVLLNRMFDMKYYTHAPGSNIGYLTPAGQKAYPQGRVPSSETQKQIFAFGTMYDIEYLLRAVIGYTSRSQLRDEFDKFGSADIGFMGAQPVELHLGQTLRYVGFISSMQVQHLIFNDRMVPMFSQVDLTFNRIPDYAAGAAARAKASAQSNQTINNFNALPPGGTPTVSANVQPWQGMGFDPVDLGPNSTVTSWIVNAILAGIYG